MLELNMTQRVIGVVVKVNIEKSTWRGMAASAAGDDWPISVEHRFVCTYRVRTTPIYAKRKYQHRYSSYTKPSILISFLCSR